MSADDFERVESAIPGLGPEPTTGRVSEVERAARSTIQHLHEMGHVRDHHAVVCAMILAAARAIDRGASSGRASAVAMAMKELREAYLLLVPESEGGAQGGDGWLDFEAEFRAAAEAGGSA